MKRHLHRNQRGSAEVEAIIILPIAVLSTLLLLYLSLFLFQRAALQAALETAVVYYKNTVTDTYVTQNDELNYTQGDHDYMGAGNSYYAAEPLSPYRGMFGDGNNLNDDAAFRKYFESVVGSMLFDDNLTITIDYSNYVYLKQFEVTATQTVSAPIDFHMIGVGNEYSISAAARVAVLDHDGTIRDLDYAIDLIARTKIGEWARTLAGKVQEAYAKMREVLGG